MVPNAPAQNVHCAFLRGVNVNGHKITMAELKEALTVPEFTDVRTVLGTGNIIFQTRASKDAAQQILNDTLEQHYSFSILKTSDEVHGLWDDNPFTPTADYHVYALISDEQFAHTAEQPYSGITPVHGEHGELAGETFYWHVPKGQTLSAGFSPILGKAEYKKQFSSRNINTIEKIKNSIDHH